MLSHQKFSAATKKSRKMQQNQGLGLALDPIYRGMVASEFDHVWPREFDGENPVEINSLENCAMLNPFTNWALGKVQAIVAEAHKPLYYQWKLSLIFKSGNPANGVKTYRVETIQKMAKQLKSHTKSTIKVRRARRMANQDSEITTNIRRMNNRKVAHKLHGGRAADLKWLFKSWENYLEANK